MGVQFAMDADFVDTLAHAYELPSPAVEKVALRVAERCALIANRFEAGAASDPASSAQIGAHIGAAILAEFGPGDLPV
jgi:hypothetical protein